MSIQERKSGLKQYLEYSSRLLMVQDRMVLQHMVQNLQKAYQHARTHNNHQVRFDIIANLRSYTLQSATDVHTVRSSQLNSLLHQGGVKQLGIKCLVYIIYLIGRFLSSDWLKERA